MNTTPAPADSRPRRPRWYRLYFLLAAFDFFTILFSLYLNHRLLVIHADAVAVNQSWAERLSRLAELGQLAGAVNAPGNDVFDSRDVPKESARLRAGLAAFDLELQRSEAEIVNALPREESGPFRVGFQGLREAMAQMISESQLIFAHFAQNQPDKAGERMATMDRRFADVSAGLAQLNRQIRHVQSRHFDEQLAVAARLRRFEYLIAIAILLMVGAACLYGHKMASAMASAAVERERFVAELQTGRGQLERRVEGRTRELAQANAALVREVADRTRAADELRQAQEKLVESSRQAGMAEVATGVLHNVGNVLNSVNVSAEIVIDQLRKSKTAGLARAVELLRKHRNDLGEFLTQNPQGKQLPAFFEALSEQLTREQAMLTRETQSLQQNIEHIKQIVAMQQSYAKISGVLEILAPHELVEDALLMVSSGLARHHVEVVRQFDAVPPVLVDRHLVLQILVNLFSNARQALDGRADGRRLLIGIACTESGRVRVEVTDNGAGIAPENLTRIFQHGFTTKRGGHGFGLHSSAIAAKKMGGSLNVLSDGPGTGATFILELPQNLAHKTAA